MKKQTEGRAAKGGTALRRVLAGALAVLMLCTAVPVYAQAPADVSQAASSQAAAGAGSAPVQEGTAGGDASSVPGQGAASEAPEAPSEGDASEPEGLPAEEEPSEDASAPADEAGTASSEQEADAPVKQAAEPAPQAASGAEESGGEQEAASGPVAGQTYWFQLDGKASGEGGTAFTDLDLRSQMPRGLEWVPMTFSGTISAYVLNSNATNAGDSASVAGGGAAAEQNAEEKGRIYEHQLFLSDYVMTNATSWNTVNGKGLIFGKDYEVAGITYTGRAPTGGVSEETTPLENSEYQIMQQKGYVKNAAWTAALTQDTSATDNGKTIVRGGDSTVGKAVEWEKSTGTQVGLRPVLEVKSGDEGNLRVISLDFGKYIRLKTTGNDYNGEVKHMDVVAGKNCEDVPRPELGQLEWFAPGAPLTEEELKWEDQTGKQYDFNAKIPVAGITSLKLVTTRADITSTNLPVAGETYWFDMTNTIESTKKAAVENAKNYLPAGLKWVPMTFSGTISAYVMQSSAPRKEDAAKNANKAHSKADYQHGWIYDHQVFIAETVVAKERGGEGDLWDIYNKADLIYGKDRTENDILYTLRSPSAGVVTENGQKKSLENSEWLQLWDKDYIKNNGHGYTLSQNNGKAKYDWAAYALLMTGRDTAFFLAQGTSTPNAAWRPLLEVTQGIEDTLHAVALDLGGFKLQNNESYTGADVKTMNVVMAECSKDIARPAYDELAWAGEGEKPAKENLVWLTDTGKIYEYDAKIPAAGVKTLTLVQPGITITQQPQSVTAEVGGNAVFTVQASSNGGIGSLEYQWQVKQPSEARIVAGDDGWSDAKGTNTYTEPNVRLEQTGTQYRCVVTLTYTVVKADGSQSEMAMQAAVPLTEEQKTLTKESDAATLTVKQPHTVTVNGGTGGGKYIEGAQVTLTAEDRDGYRFTGWTLEGATVEDTAQKSITFTMPNQDVTATANYEELFTVTVNGGAIKGGGQSGQFAAGETVTLTAQVPQGHKFEGWMFSPEVNFLEGTNAGSATVVFQMPQGSVTAKAVTSAPASNTPAPVPGASGQKPNPKTGVGA